MSADIVTLTLVLIVDSEKMDRYSYLVLGLVLRLVQKLCRNWSINWYRFVVVAKLDVPIGAKIDVEILPSIGAG